MGRGGEREEKQCKFFECQPLGRFKARFEFFVDSACSCLLCLRWLLRYNLAAGRKEMYEEVGYAPAAREYKIACTLKNKAVSSKTSKLSILTLAL